MEQPTYFDPDAEVVEPQHLVPKHKPFKPLRNIRTGNFFSYSFPVVFRNRSPNSDNEIVWVEGAPEHIQEKIDTIKDMHNEAVKIHMAREKADKARDVAKVRALTIQFNKILEDIEEVIYPKAEREYVESAQAKYLKEKESREMKLDRESLSALRGEAVPGSNEEAAVLKAKLKLTEEKLKALESTEEAQAAVDPVAAEPVKPASRKKASVKKATPGQLPTAE